MEFLGILFYLAVLSGLGWLLLMGLRRRAFSGIGFAALLLITLAGGAPGVLAGLWHYTGKPGKESMMLYECALMTPLLLLTGAFLFFTASAHGLRLDPVGFLAANRWLPVYAAVINLVTLAAFGLDKRAAVKDARRTPVLTLLLLCLAGGALGGLIGMRVFHHKTQKNYFTVGVPLMLLWHVLLLLLAMNL